MTCGINIKSRLVSDHLLLNICRNSEDFAKYQQCKERCREHSELPVRSSVCYTFRILHWIHLHSQLSKGNRALGAHLLNWVALGGEPSGQRRQTSSEEKSVITSFKNKKEKTSCGCRTCSFDANGPVASWQSHSVRKVEQATTHPAAQPHFNASIMSSRGAWQYHSSTSQMISLDCLQEIVFHIVFNHQTAEQMSIIENELTGIFPPAALDNQNGVRMTSEKKSWKQNPEDTLWSSNSGAGIRELAFDC